MGSMRTPCTWMKSTCLLLLNDLKRTGISDAYKNGTRITC